MIRVRLLLYILSATILYLPVHAREFAPQQTELVERLLSLAKNAPNELAYIQTSKDIYETGEDLWFKVYLLDAQYLNPSELSKTLYLQMFNEESKKIIWQEKYEIEHGIANGRVYLENNLPEGDYLLAAYTANSFLNDTTEFYAIRRIKVKTDITSQELPKATIVKKRSHDLPLVKQINPIQFTVFPEGGNLVAGIRNKLAFKAVNINGEPVDITGTLFEDNTPLIQFKSTHAGMGSFYFVPVQGKNYIIRLSSPAVESPYILPEIFSSGMSLQLSGKDEEFLSFKVTQSDRSEKQDIYLRIQCRGVVYGLTTAKLHRELRIKVPFGGLPQGIAEVTLFNSNFIPVAERLVYVNKNQKLNISAELSKEIYSTRGKATLKIKVTDENGWPVAANLGVSVFDKLYQNPRDSNNILSHFYLSTQLKGKIYNPSYYFNSKSKDRNEALDLLMLTQGWRKYIWNERNLRKSEETPSVINDAIHGAVYYPHRFKKVPKRQVFVMAFSPNLDSVNLLIPADSAGGFDISANLLKRWETDYVYLKPFGPPGSQFTMHSLDPLALPEYIIGIKLTDPFEIITTFMKNHEFTYPLPVIKMENENISDITVKENGFIKIKEVTIKGRKRNIIRGKYMGILDSMAKKDDYVCPFGVLNCPRHTPDQPPPITKEHYDPKPVPGKEYYVIFNYDTPAEFVRMIVYRPNRYAEEDLLKINNLARVKAYYGVREFYKPDYDKNEADTLVPDFRNTLLWEPGVITDEKGEATLSFFCSDINTDFVGRIEGVGGEGLLGSGDFKFTVRKLIPKQ